MLSESGTTEMTAVQYYEAGMYQERLTPLTHEVVEIDDGIRSVFFYCDGDHLVYLPFFDKSKIFQRSDDDAGE